MALEKNEGTATSVTYLGILIDMLRGEICLPPDKLARIAQELRKWCEKKATSKRELLFLIGLLHQAASVVVPGRPFLRHLITLSKSVKHLHYMVRLSLAARSDILWWHTFMSTCNGLAFMPWWYPIWLASLTSDASGSWGCGTFWDSSWFQLKWMPQTR